MEGFEAQDGFAGEVFEIEPCCARRCLDPSPPSQASRPFFDHLGKAWIDARNIAEP
jgi:hypothetical protein